MKISEIKGVGKATLVGIAADLKEDKTKGGDPFTSLSLEDKQVRIPVKIWNTNLLQLEKAVGEISGKVIEISGEVREYNGSLSMSVRKDGDGELAIAIRDDIKVSEFIYVSEHEPEIIYKNLVGLQSLFTDEELKSVYLQILADKQKELVVYPFGQIYHKERGGCAEHLFRVINLAYNQVNNTPVINGVRAELNQNVLILSALGSILSAFKLFKVDENGKILEKNEFFSKVGRKILPLSEFCKYTGTSDSENIMKCKHCIACLYDDELTPEIPEAYVLKTVVESELRTYVMFETGLGL